MTNSNMCILCFEPLDCGNLSFHQRLIDDRDFCRACFDEIMEAQYESDMKYLETMRVLSIRQKQ
ncbi:MAG: hypothetical protein ABI347_06820 [Nitrososphaera sp.]|jgi:hypothetical protein